MDQRSGKAPEVQAQPLFWLDDRPVHQLIGCTAGGDSGQGGGGGDGGDGGDSGGADDGKPATSGQPATVSKAEYDALMARMQAADRAKLASEQKLKELESKDQSELEKAQKALADANGKVEALTKRQTDMITQNAFLTVPDAPVWHSNSAALKLLDTSLLTVGDDGVVQGMEAAVAKLKSDHPYLVKTDASGDGDKDGGKDGGKPKGGGGQKPPSGQSNNGGGGGGKQVDRKALEQRFPALRGR